MLSEYLNTLRQGVIPQDSTEVTMKALQYIDKKELTQDEVSELDTLLRICNILYNRTDMEILPVEDGVYDLLLEKYKKYNPNFQVGSEVITFKPTQQGVAERELFELLPMNGHDEIKEDGIFSDDLYIPPRYDHIQLRPNPIHYTGAIGKRTHDTEHQHPQLVGTLHKCKFVLMADAEEAGVANDPNVAVLERDFFGKHIAQGIISPEQTIQMVLELKYDGISVEADCSNIVLSARTRGDTGVGKASDITPILYGYQFPCAKDLFDEKIGVKFEAIMQYTDLMQFNYMKQFNYKNGRTAIVGLFGSNDAPMYRDLITLVPLAVDRDDVPVENRIQEIEFCNRYYASKNQPLRYAIIEGNYMSCLYQIKKFLEEADHYKMYTNFMYDGIVVSYLDEGIRERLGRENYINLYSMAVKFNPLSKLTRLRGVRYTVGQIGNITPMIYYEPVEFLGTIHTKSTGSSLARFKELQLREGDVLEVTYMNDVMPYVTKPDCEENRNNTNPLIEFPTVCPVCGQPLVISDSGKTARCVNWNCKAITTARMVNMLQKLNIKDISVARLSALGATSFRELATMSPERLSVAFGDAYAAKFSADIRFLLSHPVPDYMFIGSLGFPSVGRRKWRIILEKYTIDEIISMYDSTGNVNGLLVKGVGPSVKDTIVRYLPYFRDDIIFFKENGVMIDSKGQKTAPAIRFSGIRDKELVQILEDRGYDADDNGSVTKATAILIVPDSNYTSSKTKKVGPNTQIVPILDFKGNMDYYLSQI